jgi:hypothetical protein
MNGLCSGQAPLNLNTILVNGVYYLEYWLLLHRLSPGAARPHHQAEDLKKAASSLQ